MKNFIINYSQLKPRKFSSKPPQFGFSILELLATMVIAGSAVSILLFLMIEGMRYNQREQGLNQINADLKQALNYISDDLREAVYVYDGNELKNRNTSVPQVEDNSGLQYFLPSFGTNTRLILAFWKVDSLPSEQLNNLNCITKFPSNINKQNECEIIKKERRAYTLVVYLQSVANSAGKWKGESRIERYQLSKYSDLSTLTRTSGYVDPVSESSFQNWPLKADKSNLQVGIPPSNTEPLVDFVASPTNALNGSTPPTCPTTTTYIRTPYDDQTQTADDSLSFFACVKSAKNSLGNIYNQDVIIYLLGSAIGKYDVKQIKDYKFSFIKAQVLCRGVVEKRVSD